MADPPEYDSKGDARFMADYRHAYNSAYNVASEYASLHDGAEGSLMRQWADALAHKVARAYAEVRMAGFQRPHPADAAAASEDADAAMAPANGSGVPAPPPATGAPAAPADASVAPLATRLPNPMRLGLFAKGIAATRKAG